MSESITMDLTEVNQEEEPVVEQEEEEPVVEQEEEEEEEEEPVVVEESTQEVVQNEQENVTSEPAVSDDTARLEERVKVLEERLESLIQVFKNLNTSYTKEIKYKMYNF